MSLRDYNIRTNWFCAVIENWFPNCFYFYFVRYWFDGNPTGVFYSSDPDRTCDSTLYACAGVDDEGTIAGSLTAQGQFILSALRNEGGIHPSAPAGNVKVTFLNFFFLM